MYGGVVATVSSQSGRLLRMGVGEFLMSLYFCKSKGFLDFSCFSVFQSLQYYYSLQWLCFVSPNSRLTVLISNSHSERLSRVISVSRAQIVLL